MNSKTVGKTILVCFLILSGFSFWGCATLPKEILVPLNAESQRIQVYQKLPVEAALLIPEADKNYVYRVTPLIYNLSNTVFVFRLGEALEKDSTRIFSQIFKSVQVVRTPAEAQKFKIVIAPKIEDFDFRYEEGKGSYSNIVYIVFKATTKCKITLYREGAQILERNVQSPEQQKRIAYQGGFTPEEDMGEVAVQALDFALHKMAEEILGIPGLEKDAAGGTSDGLEKAVARR